MSTKIHPDKVLRLIDKDVSKAHYYCDFIPDMKRAPHGVEMRDISLSGKYRFIVASSSTTMMQGNQAVVRWYNQQQDIDFNGRNDNGNRLNRLWAQYSYPNQHAEKSSHDNFILPPFLAYPGRYDAMAQLDIRSAYYSIIRLVGLYPGILVGKSFHVSSRIDSYPFAENKTVRNALYGMCFAPRLSFYTRGVRTVVTPKRKVYNPHLVQVVQNVFHAIARKARDLGAVQWHTDGGIVPYANFWDLAQWIMDNYGLQVKLKSVGEATVYNPGQYTTPVHQPKKLSRSLYYADTINGTKGDYPFTPIDEQWLRTKLAHWVKLRGNPAIIDERSNQSEVQSA